MCICNPHSIHDTCYFHSFSCSESQVCPRAIKVILPPFYLWRCSREKKYQTLSHVHKFNFSFRSGGAWERGYKNHTENYKKLGRGGGEISLMLNSHTPPGEKQSGKQSQIFGLIPQNMVRTNEIARLLILCSTSI